MCKKRTRVIGIILILVGMLLLGFQLSPTFIVSQNAKTNETIIQNISSEEISENTKTQGEIDFTAVDNLSADMALEEGRTPPTEWIIGQLVIPAVGMNLPVYNTLNNQSLLSGGAIMRHDAKMGQGNFPVAGHYTHTNQYLFGPLRDLKEGDVIRMTDKKTIYEYEAVTTTVIPPSAIEMIENDQVEKYEGQPIITLMQCYYVNFKNTGNRELFIGSLRNVYDYDERLIFTTAFYDELATLQAS